ncbi:hypothetical protein SNEBB_005185 [Seison nebaliae]|nr:hypothetical protein SNEBB_005185 [Seison nebaliae]
MTRFTVEVDPTYLVKKLKIRGKELRKILHDYKEIVNLCLQHKIEMLELSPERESCLSYRLKQFPERLDRIHKQIRILILDTNNLMTIPSHIDNFQNLQVLMLSNNQLNRLPDTFQKLNLTLVSLHLANNRFTEFPSSLCRLKSLRFLDLSSNQINELPKEISHMKQLRSLLIYGNQLTSLPENIGQLEYLVDLWLGDNNIKYLPRSICQLEYLEWNQFNIIQSGLLTNPLERPPKEICQLGMKHIRQYFSQYK